MKSCFAEALRSFALITAEEEAALAAIEGRERHYPRHSLICVQDEPIDEILLLRSGIAYSSVSLPDGSRQIMKVHFDNDMLSTSAFTFSRSIESLHACTDVSICSIPLASLRELFAKHTRILALFLTIMEAEHAASLDRMAVVGRTTARERVATLIVRMHSRLKHLNPNLGNSLPLFLTQEEMGDAVGLTPIYVNRMLRALSEEGLIERAGGNIRILDEPRLREIGRYRDLKANMSMDWLPPAQSPAVDSAAPE